MNNFISLNKVSKFFLKKNRIKALTNINLDFNLGKIYSLIGPSGSGKSTLLNLISLIDKPTLGSITIENRNINYEKQNINDSYRSASIGIIYQNYNLLNDFTALENVSIAGLALNNNPKLADLNAKKVLSSFGLSKRLNHFPSELSGGESQRVAIARAIILEPKLILLDEPTSALDVSIQMQILHLLKDLQSRLGLAFLCISHDLKVIRFLSDYVYVMKDGIIVEDGTSEDLFETPKQAYTKELLAASLA